MNFKHSYFFFYCRLIDIKSNKFVHLCVIINLDILETLCPLEWSGHMNGLMKYKY